MSKARISIEYNGKTYRVGKSHKCKSKRDCDLFERGVCDGCDYTPHYPCEAIGAAFIAIVREVPGCCYKEVRAK